MSEEKHPPPIEGEELSRLRKVFDMLDKDGDGEIPLKEFDVAMEEEMGGDLTEQQRQTLLRKADKNRDGNMNFREFAMITSSRKTEGKRFRRFLYRMADMTLPYDQRPQFHSYLSQYRCCPPPVFMILISIAEVAVFLYYTLKEGVRPGWFKGCGGCFETTDGITDWGPLPFLPHLRNEAWRFISYMFVHSGIEHLLGNVIIQLILGIPLELVHKSWRIAPLYLAGVLLGSMLQYVLDPKVILVGASGGVYALMLAHLANLILNWAEMPIRWFRLGGLVAFLAFDLVHALYRRLALHICDQVSYTSHVGGAIAGLMLGVMVMRNFHPLKWENVIRWLGLGLFVAIFIFAFVMIFVIEPGEDAILSLRVYPPGCCFNCCS